MRQIGGMCVVALEGAITIPFAAELKLAILQALESGKNFSFDLQNATELDITALQLLWATERAAGIKGLAATISGQVPDCIQAVAFNAGFQAFPIGSE
jgi:16S rRNA U1498 N3-methylase RsmE